MAETLESLAAAIAALRADVELLSKQLGEGRAGFATEGLPEPIETFRVAAPVSTPDVLIGGRSVEERINAGRADIRRLDELTDGRLAELEAKVSEFDGGSFLGNRAFDFGPHVFSHGEGWYLTINPDEYYGEGVIVDSGLSVSGDIEVNNLRSNNENQIRVQASVQVDGALDVRGELKAGILSTVDTHDPHWDEATPGAAFNGSVGISGYLHVSGGEEDSYFGGYVHIGEGLSVDGQVNVSYLNVSGAIVTSGPVQMGGLLKVDADVYAKNFHATGGDCAEQFDVVDDFCAEPGTVMVIGDNGKLEPCVIEHNYRVAGVVSGAGELRTALILNERPGHRAAIALMGSVYCKCDATYGAIAAGDLLTTSATVGHAMRANEADARIGSVIGKALKPLPGGRGLIPILVAPR